MLDRNRRIKKFPQRFQDEREEEFDIVITAEERVYEIYLIIVCLFTLLTKHFTLSPYQGFRAKN